jgi:predicted nucleic acid-binding protein
MVAGLLDTDILIDMLRLHLPAKQWISTQPDLGVASIVWLELLQGAINKEAQKRALELLDDFEKLDLQA